jgi:hypothetical protein
MGWQREAFPCRPGKHVALKMRIMQSSVLSCVTRICIAQCTMTSNKLEAHCEDALAHILTEIGTALGIYAETIL